MTLPVRSWGTPWRSQKAYMSRAPSTHSFAFSDPGV